MKKLTSDEAYKKWDNNAMARRNAYNQAIDEMDAEQPYFDRPDDITPSDNVQVLTARIDALTDLLTKMQREIDDQNNRITLIADSISDAIKDGDAIHYEKRPMGITTIHKLNG